MVKEFIEFLWGLLWNDISDGDIPSNEEIQILKIELNRRDLLSNTNGEFPA